MSISNSFLSFFVHLFQCFLLTLMCGSCLNEQLSVFRFKYWLIVKESGLKKGWHTWEGKYTRKEKTIFTAWFCHKLLKSFKKLYCKFFSSRSDLAVRREYNFPHYTAIKKGCMTCPCLQAERQRKSSHHIQNFLYHHCGAWLYLNAVWCLKSRSTSQTAHSSPTQLQFSQMIKPWMMPNVPPYESLEYLNLWCIYVVLMADLELKHSALLKLESQKQLMEDSNIL